MNSILVFFHSQVPSTGQIGKYYELFIAGKAVLEPTFEVQPDGSIRIISISLVPKPETGQEITPPSEAAG